MILKRLMKIRRRREQVYPENCPNCNHPITGKYCSHCGQSVVDFHRPFITIVRDLLGDLVAMDNRLFRTLIPLFLRPGFLVKEFMKGRRVRYMPPFKLYLFVTFVAFLLLSYNHAPSNGGKDALLLKGNNGKSFSLDSLLMEDDDQKIVVQKAVAQKSDTVHISPNKHLDFAIAQSDGDDGGSEERSMEHKVRALINLYKLNPGLVIDNVFKKLSQTLFVILPLFALFLALLYVRQRRYLIEHMLVSVNYHSFIFLIIILSELFYMIGWSVTTTVAVYLYAAIPIRLFVALKMYYKQSWLKTTVKFMILSFFYNIMLFSALLVSLILMLD